MKRNELVGPGVLLKEVSLCVCDCKGSELVGVVLKEVSFWV